MGTPGRWDEIARGALVGAALVGCGLMAWRVTGSPSGRLIVQAPDAPWIAPDTPLRLGLQQWRRRDAPPADYRLRFELPAAAQPATLAVRTFGDAELFLNEAPLALPAANIRNWRRFRQVEVSNGLRSGSNELRVRVRNLRGPPLLSLRLTGESSGLPVASGPHWRVVLEDGIERGTVLARDDVLPAEARLAPTAPAAARERVFALATLACAAALMLVLLHARAGAGTWARLPPLALAGVVALWLALFAFSFSRLPLAFGFDAPHHVRYVQHLRAAGRLPLPADDWSTYHPPLFYLLGALAAALGEALGVAAATVQKLVPWLAGLAQVGLAWALARRLAPGRPGVAAAAVLFAGCLPVNLLTASHFSNEGLHGALAALAITVAVFGLLETGAPSQRRLALFSGVLGLAALTKFTALLVAAVAGVALAARVAASARDARGLALRASALILPALALCGWFYARNVLLYGRPVVGNWNLPVEGGVWWSPPGFHTTGYYLTFGVALVHPFFGGVAGFWDCLYSTLWGDGLLSGRITWGARPPWSTGWMAAGVLLALPATAILGWGFVRCGTLALRDPDGGRRAAFGLLVALVGAFGFALLHVTLALPYYGQARASYASALIPTVALILALGAADLDGRLAARGWRAARVALGGYFAVLLATFARSFLPGS